MEKKIERIFCYIVSIIVLVLIILTIKKIIFLPALLLMTSLLSFEKVANYKGITLE